MKCKRCGKEKPAEIHTCIPGLYLSSREKIEKMFDDRFGKIYTNSGDPWEYEEIHNNLKEFIFDTILPEILGNVIDIRTDEYDETDGESFEQSFSLGCNVGIERIKQKAKDRYNINL